MIAEKGLFQATGFKRDQVKEGAITDPASLRGQVAVHDLVPGQQLTDRRLQPAERTRS